MRAYIIFVILFVWCAPAAAESYILREVEDAPPPMSVKTLRVEESRFVLCYRYRNEFEPHYSGFDTKEAAVEWLNSAPYAVPVGLYHVDPEDRVELKSRTVYQERWETVRKKMKRPVEKWSIAK